MRKYKLENIHFCFCVPVYLPLKYELKSNPIGLHRGG